MSIITMAARRSALTGKTGAVRALTLACAVAVLAVAGCGRANEEKADGQTTGQVVARVNGTEITTLQVSAAVAQLGVPANADLKPIREQVVRSLVDQEILRQAGAAAGADKNPNVMQLLANTRAQIYAQVAVENATRNVNAASTQDVDAFLAANPDMFGRREFFIFETVAAPSAQVTDAVFTQLQTVDAIDQAVGILQAANIPNQFSSFSSYSNQLDPRFLEELLKLPPGESFIVRDQATVTFTRIVSRRAAPLTGGDAREVAQAMRDAVKRQEAQVAFVEAQRKAAKVEFLGEYASLTITPAAPAPAAGASPTSPPAAATPPGAPPAAPKAGAAPKAP